MKYRNLVLLLSITTATASCVSSKKTEKPTGVILIQNPDAAEVDIRLNKFFRKSAETSFGESDQIKVDVELQIPEIEIPRSQKYTSSIQVPASSKIMEKLISKQDSSKSISAYNGHVCLQVRISSTVKIDYSKLAWQAELVVDKKTTKTSVSARPSMLISFDKNEVTRIPGETDITVCSTAKHQKVTNVQFRLKNLTKVGPDAFTWSAPWPELD